MRWAATCVVVLLATVRAGDATVRAAGLNVGATIDVVPTAILEVEPLDDAVALRLTLLYGAAENDVDVVLEGDVIRFETEYWVCVPARGTLPKKDGAQRAQLADVGHRGQS